MSLLDHLPAGVGAALFEGVRKAGFVLVTERRNLDSREMTGWYRPWFYRTMENDEVRNAAYRAALRAAVAGKSVLELGTGPNIFLSRMCVEAGAAPTLLVHHSVLGNDLISVVGRDVRGGGVLMVPPNLRVDVLGDGVATLQNVSLYSAQGLILQSNAASAIDDGVSSEALRANTLTVRAATGADLRFLEVTSVAATIRALRSMLSKLGDWPIRRSNMVMI